MIRSGALLALALFGWTLPAAAQSFPPGCSEVCSATCVKPWSLPDRWDDSGRPGWPAWTSNGRWDCEAFTDLDGDRLWDPGEPFQDGRDTQGATGPQDGAYTAELYDPSLTGYTAGADAGRLMTLKTPVTTGPGYYPLALPIPGGPRAETPTGGTSLPATLVTWPAAISWPSSPPRSRASPIRGIGPDRPGPDRLLGHGMRLRGRLGVPGKPAARRAPGARPPAAAGIRRPHRQRGEAGGLLPGERDRFGRADGAARRDAGRERRAVRRPGRRRLPLRLRARGAAADWGRLKATYR